MINFVIGFIAGYIFAKYQSQIISFVKNLFKKNEQ